MVQVELKMEVEVAAEAEMAAEVAEVEIKALVYTVGKEKRMVFWMEVEEVMIEKVYFREGQIALEFFYTFYEVF